MQNYGNYKRILIRAPNWIGDSILSFPAVNALRHYFSDSYIGVLAKPNLHNLWCANPDVNEIIKYDDCNGFLGQFKLANILKSKKFDLALIFPTSFSSAFSVFLAGIKERIGYKSECRGFLLSKSIVPKMKFRVGHLAEEYLYIVSEVTGVQTSLSSIKFNLNLFPDTIKRINAIFEENGIGKDDIIVGLAPCATYGPAKRWPISKFIETGKLLTKNNEVKLVVLGGEGEEKLGFNIVSEIKNAKNFVGKFSIDETMAAIKRCKVVLSNDTGLMHIAAAFNIPVVAIFGSTSPIWTAPLGDNHIVLYKKLSCGPCFKRICPLGTYECFNKITSQEVYEKMMNYAMW
ncbi:MAG: lipopolysaccharide heptosyltransferase II [Candidatus Firestonebacteria bacterium]